MIRAFRLLSTLLLFAVVFITSFDKHYYPN